MLESLKAATVPATMSDGSTRTLNVSWKKIEQENGRYYAVGEVNVLGTPHSVAPQEVKVEIQVVNPFTITAATAEHGSVAVDKASAYAGETVTITVTPDSHQCFLNPNQHECLRQRC